MKNRVLLSILFILPGLLWCPGECEAPELIAHGHERSEFDPEKETGENSFEKNPGMFNDHEALFAGADVNTLLEKPDIVPAEGAPLIKEFQPVHVDQPGVATVTTTIDPLLSVGDVEVTDQAAKTSFLNDIHSALLQGDALIENSENAIKNLQSKTVVFYADYASILEQIDEYVRKVLELQNGMIDFDYSDAEQTQMQNYEDKLDVKIEEGRNLLDQLQGMLDKKVLNDIPVLYKKVQDLQVSFGKINKSSWWGGKSLSDVAAQLNEIHILLDNVLTVGSDASYKNTVQDMKDIVRMLDRNLVKMQLDALRSKDLIARSFNAIQMLESQPATGYVASARGKAEMKDARGLLKELDAILLDDPLYRDRYLAEHKQLAFERLNQALDAAGIERRDDETENDFLSRPEVQALREKLFPQVPDVGAWRDSLDFNVALTNAKYLRGIYLKKKRVLRVFTSPVESGVDLGVLVKEANKRFISGKRSSKSNVFPVEDSLSQSRGSITSE